MVKYAPSCDRLRRFLPVAGIRQSLRMFGFAHARIGQCRRLPGAQNKHKKESPNKMIDKAAVRAEFQRHDRDTGSSEVQIAQLTKEIQALTEHLKQNKKDHSSRYGLLRKVNNRRSLLDYLKREDEAKYRDLIKKLGLRR